jgi:hypothetical protein
MLLRISPEPLVTTSADYDHAVDMFRQRCSQIPGVVSVLLYGSIAQGTVRVGKSDIMDAVVVLEDCVLQDQHRFCEVLEKMVEICRYLSRLGIPFHPFHYCTRYEFSANQFGLCLAAWRDDRMSCVLWGEDPRATAGSSDTEQTVLRSAFWAWRRSLHGLLALTHGQAVLPAFAVRCITRFVKVVPALACLALGESVTPSEALKVLANRLGRPNVQPLIQIASMMQDGTAEEGKIDSSTVGRVVQSYERLHDELECRVAGNR